LKSLVGGKRKVWNLDKGSFKSASFKGAIFGKISLLNANCQKANFEGATLSGKSTIRSIDARGANLKVKNPEMIDWRGIKIDQQTQLPDSLGDTPEKRLEKAISLGARSFVK